MGFLAPIWGDPCPPSPRCRLCFSLSCFPGRFVLFRRCVLFGLLPAVGTRLRGQNEPIFQGSFCKSPVREVSGIGLQPCPPSGAAQPPPAGTESAHLWACASSVCICIALHIERLTGLLLRDDLPRRLVHTYRFSPGSHGGRGHNSVFWRAPRAFLGFSPHRCHLQGLKKAVGCYNPTAVNHYLQ